jgi:hypothetical protein
MKDLKLTCIKEYTIDPEEYGIDFIVGNRYSVQSFEEDGSNYVESESGSDVLLSYKEMKEIFGV